MSEHWTPIVDFPRYEISDQGNVNDTKTKRTLIRTLVQKKIPTVGLVRNGYVYRRSVPLLVATHWLFNDLGEPFDTPMHLDGDRSNCCLLNLIWRPRWFAVNYHREKLQEEVMPEVRVILLQTGEVFETIRQASVSYGFMEDDIIKSIDLGVEVWPDHVNFDYY